MPQPPSSPSASDIPRDGWVDRLVPAPARPYMRLARFDRPIGAWLLLLPGWWAIAMTGMPWPDWSLVVLFGFGAVLMRGAGCVVNDLTDRDFDARVARTADRPLPSGQVSIRAAFGFLALLLALSLIILLRFNNLAIAVGAASLIFVVIYPWCKRFTYWPQAFLGLTFNWGALLGWAAARGTLDSAALILYAAGFFWTLGYDTIYAHQDKDDDALVGVKSTALLFRDNSRPWIAGFYAMATALLIAAGLANSAGPVFFAGVALAAAHLAWQTTTVNINDAKDCLAKFKSNRQFGLILFAAFALDRVIAS